MLPATSKSSRRSSILKLPKRCNSQNAESNSSEENSPTKLKRRVSFAEKKSVKEFADSLEQGTVWDSTYEESDSSQIRMSHSEYAKSVVIKTSTHLTFQSSQNQETILANMLVRPEIEFKFPTEAPRLSHVDPEILANKENMPEILGLGEIESSLVEVEDIPVQTSGFAVYCDEDNLNETNTEEVPMECTIVADALVPENIEAHVPANNGIGEQDRTQIFGNESVEFTEAISSNSCFDKAPLLFDKSMEMTEAVSSNLFRAAERTELFHDKSMELTEAVPSVKLLPHRFDKTVLHNKSMELTEAVPSLKLLNCSDRTLFFHNKSVELTEAVPRTVLPTCGLMEDFNSRFQVPEDKTEAFQNKSMEMTEAIRPQTNFLHKVLEDKTEVFQNKSMEFTEAICPRNDFVYKVPEDKTEVFQNKSMELTEAIHPQMNFPDKIHADKTEVFQNKSMELTETIRPQTNFLCKVPENKTEVFHNKSMDLTKAIVPGLKLTHDNALKLSETLPAFNMFPESNSNEEKTQLFHNKSMEMTGVVSLVPYQGHRHEEKTENINNRPIPFPEEKTQFFSNKSMEITPAISFQDRQDQEIEHNYFMENTVSINPSLKRSYKCIADSKIPKSAVSSPNPKNPRDCQIVDRKVSMNLLHRILHQDLDDQGPSLPETFEGDGSQEESMEMTVAIPSLKIVDPEDYGARIVEPEVPFAKVIEPEISDAKTPLNSEPFPEDYIERPINEAAEYQEASEVEISVNSTAFNEKETLAPFDDKIPSDDIGATSVFLEETPSFMYTSDPDLDNDKKNNFEPQNLDLTQEYEDKSHTIESSRSEESGVESISRDFSGCSLKRSMFEDEEEEIERKKFMLIHQDEDPEIDEEIEEHREETIEKIYLPEIGTVEGNEINVKLQELLVRDEVVTRKLKACWLEEPKKYVEKIQKPEVLRQSESKTRFDVLKEGLEEYAGCKSSIWKVHTINPEVICIEFYKTALVLGVRIAPGSEEERIFRVRVLPRVNDEDTEMLKMTDRFILRAIDCDRLAEVYFSYADIPKLIADVTEQVQFVYDFYDELVKFHRVNLVDLAGDIVTVTVRTKKMETIIKLIIDISSYPVVTPEDISIIPILGIVKEGDVKNLVKNLKPSPKLLTLYINDVKELLELLAIANSKN